MSPEQDKPLDYSQLRSRGYTEREAYGLLRRHGVKVPGGRKRRITLSLLTRIERGEIAP